MIRNLDRYSMITLIVVFDIIFFLMIFSLAYFLRADVAPKIISSIPKFEPGYNLLGIMLTIWMMFLWYEGLYTKKLFFWDEVKILWKSSLIVPALILIFVSLTKSNEHVSRLMIGTISGLSIFLFPLYRFALKKTLKKLNIGRTTMVFIGSKKAVFNAYRAIASDVNCNCKIKLFILTDISRKRKIGSVTLIPFKPGINRFVNLLGVDELYVCMHRLKFSVFQTIIEDFQLKTKNIFIIPDLKEFPLISSEFHLILQNQTFILELKNSLLNFIHRTIKDILERFIAVLLVVVLFIPMMIISILIKIDSEGPVIFVQYRAGKDGRLFRIYKFRTMYINSEEILDRYFISNPDAKKEFDKFWKLKNDPRVTRLGKFLRKTSLDEIPQLFNVIRGDMSLVGPRPYLPEEIKFLGKNQDIILSVKPGITGLWQISGRSNKDYRTRIALDLWYIRNWSLWIDIVILIKTFFMVIKREGAY